MNKQYYELSLSEKLEYIYTKYGYTKDEAKALSYFADLEDEAKELETALSEARDDIERLEGMVQKLQWALVNDKNLAELVAVLKAELERKP